MKLYLKLLKFVQPYGFILGIAIFMMFISTLFDGISLSMLVPLADNILTGKKIVLTRNLPTFLENLISVLNATPRITLLKFSGILIILLFTLKGITVFLQGYLMNSVSQKVIRDLRNFIYEKIQSLSLDFFVRSKSGALISRITYDVVWIQTAISEALADLIFYSLQLILFTFIIFFIHPKLALISFILLPLIGLPAVRIGKLLRKISKRAQEKMAEINTDLYESIAGARIVKAFSMEDYEIKKFRKYNQDFYHLMLNAIKKNLALGPITEFFGACAGVFVLYLGGKEVIKETISFGVFVLFLGALLSLLKPFKRLSKVYTINQQALSAVVRILEILNLQPSVKEIPSPYIMKSFEKEIVFENVSFSYEEKIVLQDINLKIKKGEVVAIVGPTGSGKTTLVNLIPRFYDPREGRVLIDGRDIKEMSLKSLRSHIGMVTQETILFNDTVRMNIAYGRPETDFAEIVMAAKTANAHEFIMHLPYGYDTLIGEQGAKLSGGERQRIAIARAVLKNPSILILDEATSQLDSVAEKIVQEALERLMRERTVVIIAHRLSTIKGADRIVVLQNGRIVETGRHEELMAQGTLYKEIYQMQKLVA
ncbi:MAG: ABC transporter ATP-binding protein/permease [Candidatus Omnitrophica bacterium]|nr:ABC transporter ATP-binding protein/permease [Candidatus Omnitrophota bacterium]MCM8798504.1 ABC transporter ATP-binding protein/permease [Candidatus Omnitrophota bacterium]